MFDEIKDKIFSSDWEDMTSGNIIRFVQNKKQIVIYNVEEDCEIIYMINQIKQIIFDADSVDTIKFRVDTNETEDFEIVIRKIVVN